ncbi:MULTISPECIES: hypothetical protein [unclassified Polaromonas]|uniref:hypothetical protein n=1 Tax=unclassified Polaromonas TaxID=2638319 RepID=UPI0018CA302F|nr:MULTISPECIES: hypothetical protein [unclassified Polaromonas]MBG6073678.1 hypothetical protein [Polaromonas sp. CG_9.7]MBG6115680.1 hypothetical protein [Polaromonas sp. CG_9.2]MDH6186624.1 hypothetical protein [Polaromonas sp. CG_23.6]
MAVELGIRLANGTSAARSASASLYAHVAEALLASKNEAAEPEILRLSKVLARLQATAELALAQSLDATGKTSASFTNLLDALSHD